MSKSNTLLFNCYLSMKAALLLLAFAWISAGWHCAADGCHGHGGDHPIAHADGSHDEAAQPCCDCLGCQSNVAFELCIDDGAVPAPAVSERIETRPPAHPPSVLLDGPFHPPRA